MTATERSVPPAGTNQPAAPSPAEMLAAAEFTNEEAGYYDAGYIAGYAEGYRLGAANGSMASGYAAGWLDHEQQVSDWLAPTIATLRQPTLAEMEASRVVDHQPCPTKCRKCSRCIHSLAYYGRGGRDFLGIEAERAVAAGEATPVVAAAAIAERPEGKTA